MRRISYTRLGSTHLLFLLLFVGALLLRVVVAFELRDLPTSSYLVMDARGYDSMALEIAGGKWLPTEPFYQAPLYPYFLASVYSIFGHSYVVVRLLQALAGALAAWLIAVATKRTFGNTAGVASFLLAAFYGPLVFYTQPLLKPALTSLLLAFFVFFALGREGGIDIRPSRLVLAGASLGGAILLRENLLMLLLGTLVALAWALRREPRRRLFGASLLFTAAVAAMLLPVAWANHHASGQWILVSSNGGMNFLIGNSRGGTGLYRALEAGSQSPGSQQRDARKLARAIQARESGSEGLDANLSEGEISRIFWRESLREIRADVPGWLALMARKSLYFWNRYEVPGAEGYGVTREHSRSLRLSVVGFGVVAPLALLGLATAPREARGSSAFLALMALGVFVSVVLFFIFARFRLPVVVFLLPLAGSGIANLVSRFRRREIASLGMALAVLIGAATAVWYPAFPPEQREELAASNYFNLGMAANHLSADAYEELGRLSDAEQRVTRVVHGTWRANQAVDYLEKAAPAGSTFGIGSIEKGVAQQRLGSFLLVGGRVEEAVASYRAAEETLRHALTLELDGDLRSQAESVITTVTKNLELATTQRPQP